MKYNDVNDDEHLTQEEFYTAFGEYGAFNSSKEEKRKIEYITYFRRCMVY